MMRITCITRQFLLLELKTIKNSQKGGVSIILVGIMSILLSMICFLYIADFDFYNLKADNFQKSIESAITAATMEIENSNSTFDEEFSTTGNKAVANIRINEAKALNIFYSMLLHTTGFKRETIEKSTLAAFVWYENQKVKYTIYKGGTSSTVSGETSNIKNLETIINQNYNFIVGQKDTQNIYVSSNPYTNDFSLNPYFIVFIKNFKMKGLFPRETTFISFSSGRIYRK